nr:MAG TPA: hypothetical protein [Caudoviricetes sp.]
MFIRMMTMWRNHTKGCEAHKKAQSYRLSHNYYFA